MPKRKVVSPSSHGIEIIGAIENGTSPTNVETEPLFDPKEDLQTKSFTYEPLNRDDDTIRVLDVLPGSGESLIYCQMRVIARTKANYTCLSYTWQPEDPRHYIKINGEFATIGHNLWLFLRQFRSGGFKDSLWVDAVCINQPDIEEKSYQVQQMGRTYQHATRILVWLGDTEGGVSAPLNEIGEVAASFDQLLSMQPKYRDTKMVLYELSRELTPDQKASLKASILLILSVPYWSRVWIAQEIMLAEKAFIIGGTNLLSLDSPAVLYLLWDVKTSVLNGKHSNLPAWNYISWRDTKADPWTLLSSHKILLSALLPKFAESGCKNVLDRVYGVLSLAEDAHKFLVDYSASPEQLFRYTMEFCMDGRPLDDLLLVGATLIRSLGLRPPRETLATLETGTDGATKSNRELEDVFRTTLSILYTSSKAVVTPIWGQTCLDIGDPSGNYCGSERASCMYLTICAGEDTHVFEYVVEENDAGVYVKYARAHEYVRGTPTAGRPHISSNQQVQLWISRPSEEVCYFREPESERKSAPPLFAWRGPQLRLLDVTSSDTLQPRRTPDNQPSCYLKPARRSIARDDFWEESSVEDCYHFTSIRDEVEAEIERRLTPSADGQMMPREDLGLKSVTLNPRSRTLLWIAKSAALHDDGLWQMSAISMSGAL